MEQVNFMQQYVELAKSSQYLIESLWEIGTEVSKFNVPLISVFFPFFETFSNIFYYQSSLYKSVYNFNLPIFSSVFPYYPGDKKVPERVGEKISVKTGKLAFPLFFDFSVIGEVSRVAFPKTEEKTKLDSFRKPSEKYVADNALKDLSKDVSQKTPVHSILEMQTQLWSQIAPSVKILSSVFLQYEKQVVPLPLLMAMSKSAILDHNDFLGFTAYRFSTFSKEEKVKSAFPKHSTKKFNKKTLLDKETISETTTTYLIGGITFGPETLRVVDFVANLSTAIVEKQIPFQKVLTNISRLSLLSISSLGDAPSYQYGEPVSEPPTSIPPNPIDLRLEKNFKFSDSFINKSSTSLDAIRGSLLALPAEAAAVEKLVAETLIQPISSSEESKSYEDRESSESGLTPTNFKPVLTQTPIEAFRLPSILTSVISNYIQSYSIISSEPISSQIYQTSIDTERFTLEESKPTTEKSESNQLSKSLITLALATTQKLLTKVHQQETTTFMKKIQILRLTYASSIADFGAAGPIRTTMLGEVASGLGVPSVIEPSSFNESVVLQQPPLDGSFSSMNQDAVNVTVFAELAEEDLRNLERKIHRILSDQMSRYYGSSMI